MEELKELDKTIITPDSLQDSLDINPILDRFECKFNGYLSLRKKIENEIDSLSQENIFDPFIYDPDDHFIGDLMYRTLLNSLMEVQISETVYKVKSMEWVAEFIANEPTLLDFARSYNVSNLNGRIKDTIINFVKFIYTGSDYELDGQGNLKRSVNPNCGIDIFNIVYNANGEVSFHIYPMLCGSGNFVFDFGDGVVSSPVNAWNYFMVYTTHTYLINGKYLAKITYNCDCGSTPTTKLIEINITNSGTSTCVNFPQADFDVDISVAGKLKLNAKNPSNILKYHWKITDPFEENEEETESEYITNYPKEITVEVCLKIYNVNGCFSVKCSTITVPSGCCQRGHIQLFDHINYAPDHKLKCKIFRWNGGPLGRNVGAKSVNFEKRKRKFSIRKNSNKHWIRTRIEIQVGLLGHCWAGNYEAEHNKKMGICYKEFSVNKNENRTSRTNADVTYNPGPFGSSYHRVYTKKNRLNSSHKIKYNGTWYERSLVLTVCN